MDQIACLGPAFRAARSHRTQAMRSNRFVSWVPIRAEARMGTCGRSGGGRTYRPPEPAECRIWLLSAVFMPGKTAANRRRPGGPSMARRLMAKNRLADRPRVCAGPSFVQRCANSMIRHRLPKNSVRRHQAERAKQRHARTYGSARPADPVDGSLSRERWISLK